jgi:AAA domain/UvrD-like helicase C-terminal domain
MKRSIFQQAIVDEASFGENLAIIARAGAGKSTILKDLSFSAKNTNNLLVAFNKHNAVELAGKFRGACRTSHSLGMSTLAPLGVAFKEGKSSFIARELGIPRKRTLDFEDFWNVYRLTDSSPLNSVHEAIIQDFCESDISEFYERAEEIEALALKMFFEQDYIDFADMLWCPTKLPSLPKLPFDTISLDEGQDLAPITLTLINKLRKESAQMFWVGDNYQNLFSTLNCTLSNNANEAKKLWGCKEMSLPITYRCPEAIVEEAQKYVPDIISFRQGGHVTKESFLPDEIPKGALILGAKYEFIMPEFIERRLAGERCVLRGHNFIEESLKEAKKCQRSPLYASSSVCKLAAGSFSSLVTAACEAIGEKASRVPFTLAGQARKQRFANMQNVLELLSERFSSFDEASKFAGAITKETKPDYEFSSIHRAKGSESEDVYFLEASRYEDAALDGDLDSLRLAYVATTRSQEKLTLVG